MINHVFALVLVSLLSCTHVLKKDSQLAKVEHAEESWSADWDGWSEENTLQCSDQEILKNSHTSLARACAYWRVEKDPTATLEVVEGWKSEKLSSRLLATLEAREFAKKQEWDQVLSILIKYPIDFEALSGEITLRAMALVKLKKISEARSYLYAYLDRRKGNYRWEVLAAEISQKSDPIESERRARRGADRSPAGSIWKQRAENLLGVKGKEGI